MHNTSWTELHKFGVKFPYAENPDRYNIDDLVKLGEGTELWPDIILDGKIVIGKNCIIGRGAIITGSGYIGDGTSIGHGVVLNNPKIGKNCVIDGLVIESEIGDGCVIGKFAEIKRSKLSWGINAKHVCGVRDAVIGPLTNIASETDIKNYDGVEKNKTVIGSKCFLAGKINAGVVIGDEVRIRLNSFVTGNIPSMSYHAFDVNKEHRSWYLEGYYLNLKRPIPPGNRLVFMMKTMTKLGYEFHHGAKPADKNLKVWLNTPIEHLGNISPLRALERDGCPAIDCILGECDCFKRTRKNPG